MPKFDPKFQKQTDLKDISRPKQKLANCAIMPAVVTYNMSSFSVLSNVFFKS